MTMEQKLLELLNIPGVDASSAPPTTDSSINPSSPEAPPMVCRTATNSWEEFEGEAPEAELDVESETLEKKKIVVVRDTALDLDMWDIQRGAQCLDSSEELKKAFPKHLDDKARKVIENTIADMHAIAYTMEPKLVDECTDPRRKEYIQTLLQSPDCQILRQSTVLNEIASEMAATNFGVEYSVLVKADEEREKKLGAGAKKPNPERNELQSRMGLQRAAARAMNKTKEEVDNLNETMRSLGGDGSTTNNPQEAKKIAEVYKRIKKNHSLQQIFNRAGKFRMFMQSCQRRKTKHGVDDVVSVEMGGDVHRLLPVELAMLADEDFEMDAMRRLVDQQSMCRLYQGTETVAKGPVVVCVDESGSMSGDPIWNAKAFALAMASLARSQKRWCCLIGYAGATEGTKLVIPPGKWDQAAVLEWLEHFYSGGTEMDIPLQQLPQWWGTDEMKGLPKGKTDLILITDAQVNVAPAMEASFLTWKNQAQVKCISLIIGEEPGDLAKVSDEYHKVKGITIDQDGVSRAMSI